MAEVPGATGSAGGIGRDIELYQGSFVDDRTLQADAQLLAHAKVIDDDRDIDGGYGPTKQGQRGKTRCPRAIRHGHYAS